MGNTETASKWHNWSGSVTCAPERLAAPRDQRELQKLVRDTDGPIRVHGAGHSFMPVAQTDGTLVSLDAIEGTVLDVKGSSEQKVARLQAGASLNQLSRALQDHQLGFKNLGDIDVQSLAGAVMTATHGTGKAFPCLAAEIEGIKLLTADGEILEASLDHDGDLVKAARVSLGTLGILLEADVCVRSAYKLHRQSSLEPLSQLLQDAHSLWDKHRNFEIFTLPFCDYAVKLVHDETDESDFHENPSDDDGMLRQLKLLRSITKHVPSLRRRIMNLIARSVKPEIQVGHSWQLLANERNVRFHEMEYHLPVDRGLDVLAEIMHLIEGNQREVFFPIECRMTAADDSWLSPFKDAPRISIAVHAYQKDDYHWLFDRIEPVFRRNEGRPHWGKLHSLKAREFKEIYPLFERFQQLRGELDPKGRFLNEHLGAVFDAKTL